MTLHNELHSLFFPPIIYFLKDLYIVQGRLLVPFISRKKKKNLVATV